METKLNENLATSGQHSTVGTVSITFISDEARKKGIWAKQIPLGKVAMENISKQIGDWEHDGVIEEM